MATASSIPDPNHAPAGKSPARASELYAWLPSVAVVVVCATAAFTPTSSVQTITVLIAGVLAAILGAIALFTGRIRPLPVAVWWLALPAAVLALSALASTNPTVGLTGMHVFRRGAVLWIVVWAWLAVFAAYATGKALRRLTLTLAILGAAASVMGLAQFSGILADRVLWSAEPSAFFRDSNGFAQFLLIAAGCAASWLFDTVRARSAQTSSTKRNAPKKLTPIALPAAMLLIIVAGIGVSQSRGAWVAILIGCAVLTILATDSLSQRRRIGLLGGFGLVIALMLVVILAISSGASTGTDSAYDSLNDVLNSRPAIWRSALAQVGQAPLLGQGHGSFSTYYVWSPAADRVGGVDTIGTFDPHSVMLIWALATGLPGLLVLLTAPVSYVLAIRRRLNDRIAAPAAALMAVIAAWAVMQTAEVTGLIAAPLAAGLAGMVLARLAPAPKVTRQTAIWTTAAPVAFATIAGALVVALSVSPVMDERTFLAGGSLTPDTVATIAELYEDSNDPRYVLIVLEQLLAQTTVDYPPRLATDAQMLARMLEPEAAWNVDAARLNATAWRLESPATPQGDAGAVHAALDAGRKADPVTDVWDYLESSSPVQPGGS